MFFLLLQDRKSLINPKKMENRRRMRNRIAESTVNESLSTRSRSTLVNQ